MDRDQTIEVLLKPGDRLTLVEDVDVDERGSAGTIMYEGIVEQYVPDTGLIRMDDGTERDELFRLIEEAEAVEIIHGVANE